MQEQKLELNIEKTSHYIGLDLLRGVAAVGVVWFHCCARLNLPYLFPRGYLAVDFFFVLSGLVIAHAYQYRISSGNLSIPRFAVMRATRLLPFIILGTGVAAVIEIGRPGTYDRHQHLIDTMQAILFGSFLVPMLRPTTLEGVIFPLNSPAWSLFFEVIANAVFAIWCWGRLGAWCLLIVLGVSLSGIIWALHSHVDMNFGYAPDNFWLGFFRVGWSFTVGLILFRVKKYDVHIPFVVPLILLIIVLSIPVFPVLNELIDLFFITIILPVIVWTASLSKFKYFGRICSKWSGDLSYPIYALHYPFVRVLSLVGSQIYLPWMGRLGIVMIGTLAIIFTSWLFYIFLDIPIRKWVTSKIISYGVSRDPHQSY